MFVFVFMVVVVIGMVVVIVVVVAGPGWGQHGLVADRRRTNPWQASATSTSSPLNVRACRFTTHEANVRMTQTEMAAATPRKQNSLAVHCDARRSR